MEFTTTEMEGRIMNYNKILVVDDDPSIRRIICRILNSEGILTAEASGGLEAIQKTDHSGSGNG